MSTESSNHNTNTQKDEFSLNELVIKFREWYGYLLSKWLIILSFVVFGTGIGLIYALVTKPIYTAATTFVLEESGSSAGGLSQYANIANMVGIDMGGSTNGMFTSENIIEIYKSRRMLQTVLLSEAIFDGKKQLLIDHYLEFNKIREKWKSKPRLMEINFSDYKEQRLIKDSILAVAVKDINKRYLTVTKLDKKSSIIKVSVTSTDEMFSKVLTDKIVSTVNDFYIQTKTKKSQENLAVLQRQTDSVRREMSGAIFSGATTLDATPNLNPTRQVLRAPVQKSQFDAEANKAMLGELLKNLELSKISVRKETPLIQVIDQPILPLEKIKPGLLKSIIIGGFIFGFLSGLFLMARRIIS